MRHGTGIDWNETPRQGRMAVERLDSRTYILAYNPEYGRSHQKQKGFRDKPRNPKGG